MITLKLASYSPEEKEILTKLIGQTQQRLMEYYCPKNIPCKQCPVRHICDDLHNASVYSNKSTVKPCG